MYPSQKLFYGPKLYTTKDWVWHKFHNDFGFDRTWTAPSGFYGISPALPLSAEPDEISWYLWCEPGFQWNGASLYPDWKFMMYPSLVHDCLHWMIRHGVISEELNDTIDAELRDCVLYGKTPIPWYLGGEVTRKVRAKMVEFATNRVNEKRSDLPEQEVLVIDI